MSLHEALRDGFTQGEAMSGSPLHHLNSMAHAARLNVLLSPLNIGASKGKGKAFPAEQPRSYATMANLSSQNPLKGAPLLRPDQFRPSFNPPNPGNIFLNNLMHQGYDSMKGYGQEPIGKVVGESPINPLFVHDKKGKHNANCVPGMEGLNSESEEGIAKSPSAIIIPSSELENWMRFLPHHPRHRHRHRRRLRPACIFWIFLQVSQRRSMAKLSGMRSESLPAPSAGLASILRDHKDILGASNGRANIVLGVVDALGPQPVLVSSSSDSCFCKTEGAGEWHELKEGVLATESRSCQPDLSRLQQIHHDRHHHRLPSPDPRINQLNVNGPAKNVGVVLECAKADIEVADTSVLGIKAKKRANGTISDHDFGLAKQRASREVSEKSSSRRRERGSTVSIALENTTGLYHQAQLQGALATSQEKTGSCRSSVSLMIPQVRGDMAKKLSKVYAERQSAPVQVPDWSKIMVKANGKSEEGNKDDDDDRLPPHELLAKEYARSQMTTFSVCEGHGRTLKGRDLSRVRDAVWSQMGFAD
ncbi:hypothetical protein L7F22_027805 [Adiantum nelumboides]|nr:hypothetical protein [Adiantum nelumboides]